MTVLNFPKRGSTDPLFAELHAKGITPEEHCATILREKGLEELMRFMCAPGRDFGWLWPVLEACDRERIAPERVDEVLKQTHREIDEGRKNAAITH
jgi:hypothetical protein